MKIIDLSVTTVADLPVEPEGQIAKIYYIDHGSDLSIQSTLESFPGTTREDLPEGFGWASEFAAMTTHTGTHMDAPYHYHPTMNHGEPAWTIDQMPLEWCIGNGVVFDFSDKPDGYLLTSKDYIAYLKKINYSLKPGDIVLVHTNAHEAWGSAEYYKKGCGTGREGTLWLALQGIHLVGTDAWSWDPPLYTEAEKFQETGDRSVIWEGHKAGMECCYFQMEKLVNLDQLPPFGFRFIGFPIKINRGSAGWVRPVAILED